MTTQIITLSPAEIEGIFEDYVREKYKTAKTIEFSGKLSLLIPEKIVIKISTKTNTVATTTLEPKRFSEPELRIDDTVILIGITEEGKALIHQFGNVWKLSSVATNPVPRYIMYSRHSEVQGKFSGKITGRRSSEGVANLQKDCNDPNRIFRVIGVSKFPEEFKWKMYWDKYEKIGLKIKELK